jgi:hypothetical protein
MKYAYIFNCLLRLVTVFNDRLFLQKLSETFSIEKLQFIVYNLQYMHINKLVSHITG